MSQQSNPSQILVKHQAFIPQSVGLQIFESLLKNTQISTNSTGTLMAPLCHSQLNALLKPPPHSHHLAGVDIQSLSQQDPIQEGASTNTFKLVISAAPIQSLPSILSSSVITNPTPPLCIFPSEKRGHELVIVFVAWALDLRRAD
jgi:hypothetical protein